jgi:hypothetical protein
MKCEICKKNIETTFLGKIIGSIIKDSKGKKHTICNNCQKQTQSKQEQLKNI